MRSRFISLLAFLFFFINHGQASPSDSLISSFLYQIQGSLMSGNPDLLNQSMDMKRLIDKTFSGLPAPPEIELSFTAEIADNFNLGKEITTAMGEEGHYMARQFMVSGDTIFALFRFYMQNGGLNYHEYEIFYDDDGKFRIGDAYVMSTGEYLSETFRFLLEPALLTHQSIMDDLSKIAAIIKGDRQEYMQDMEKVQLIRNEFQKGNYQKAHEIYIGMGDEARMKKAVQLMNIKTVTQLSDSLTIKYTDIYQESFPGDPSLQLMMIDNYFLKKQYDRAINAINGLMVLVGQDDGHLENMKAQIHLVAGNSEKFVEHARAAIQLEPWLPDPYFSLIQFHIAVKDYDIVVELMKLLEKEASITFSEENLKANDTFKGLLSSEAYKKWRP